MTQQGFTQVDRNAGTTWLCDTRPVWVVHYPTTPARNEFYQAYKAIQPVPRGRMPWTVDNRRIGTDQGFRTLQDAMGAAA